MMTVRNLMCLIVFCLPTALIAERVDDPFYVDYAGLLEHHADKVETDPSDDTQILNLPGNIHVRKYFKNGQVRYIGHDNSLDGAVGCSLGLLAELSVVLKLCPDMLGANDTKIMGKRLKTVAAFFAKNAFPKRDTQTHFEQVQAFVDQSVAEYLETQPAVCAPQDDPSMGGIAKMISALVSPQHDANFNNLLRVDRLPVMSPCL